MIMSSSVWPSIGSETLLVRYVEVWHATPDDGIACAGARVVGCGQPDDLGMLPAGYKIAQRSVKSRHAIVLHEDNCPLTSQLAEISGTELVSVVAVPVVRQTVVTGVVVMGLGAGYGAVESWHRDDRDELSIDQSFYAGLPSFQFMNGYIRFPKGGGIPGQIWKNGTPQLVTDPGTSEAFVRTFENDPAILDAAIGIPIGSKAGFAESVLLFLSSRQFPFANAVEVWECDGECHPESDTVTSFRLLRHSSTSLFPDSDAEPGIENWRQVAAGNMENGSQPQLLTTVDYLLPPGIEFGVALPMYHGPLPIGVVTLLF